MSFEKHAIVAPFLSLHGSRNNPYETEVELYKALAYALYEKLTKYEEQEAIDSTAPVDPLPMLYKLLTNAAANGHTDVIDVASKAIQRIKY